MLHADATRTAKPLVSEFVDEIVRIRTSQSMFVSEHAARLAAVVSDDAALSRWHLNGIEMTKREALDAVRQAPDLLSSLQQLPKEEKDKFAVTKALTKLFERLGSYSDSSEAPDLVDDLEYVVSTSEAVEVASVGLIVAFEALKNESQYEGGFEISSSRHRAPGHSLYAVFKVKNFTALGAYNRQVKKMETKASLFFHESGFLDQQEETQSSPLGLLPKAGSFIACHSSCHEIGPGPATTQRASVLMSRMITPLLTMANMRLTKHVDELTTEVAIQREKRRRVEEERKRKAEAARQAEAERLKKQDEDARKEKQKQEAAEKEAEAMRKLLYENK